jgi:hypothetical protein
MEKEVLLRPKLKRQISAENPEEAGLRSRIFKTNLSRFFTHLYAHIYGGEVQPDPWGNFLKTNGRNYSPDIVKIEGGRRIDTEVKATSTRSSRLYSPFRQEENNLYEFLKRLEKGESPLSVMEYALFQYGHRETTQLQRLGSGSLMKKLAGEPKKLVILPLPAFLYLASSSGTKVMDQKSSSYNRETQTYHVVKGTEFKKIFNNNISLVDLILFPDPILDLLHLDKLKVEHSTTSEVKGHYRVPFVVEPFPVTKYTYPEEVYEKVAGNLLEHHAEIARNLEIRDILERNKSLPDLPF